MICVPTFVVDPTIEDQGIHDTLPPSYRAPKHVLCNYNPTNRAPKPKKDPEGILIQGQSKLATPGLKMLLSVMQRQG
ncbi:hypothetical protein TNCV_2280441 [Trichonephila clavipes]|nr:hypothetical protein TNCV_2280441 [Trichonephila clavipes]